jgi:DivIVA domain-containing protein
VKHHRFAQVGWAHKGYHRRQVDAFLDHCEIRLTGAIPGLSAADVRRAGFELVRRGYDPAQVDAALDDLEERALAAHTTSGGRRGRLDPVSESEFLRRELSAPYMHRFPRARALRRGYDIDDVDDFLDRVTQTLEGRAWMPVADVRGAGFRPRLGGYDEDAVDDALDRVVELMLLLRDVATDRGEEVDNDRPPSAQQAGVPPRT